MFLLFLFAITGSLACESESSEGTLDGDYRVHCGGRGVRYCRDPWMQPCPGPCMEECREGSADDASFGDVREDIEDAVKNHYFDQVFIDEDRICVANCKRGRGCQRWTQFWGHYYCRALRCSIDGCHQRKDFVRISCFLCTRIFPRCYKYAS